MVSVGDKAPDVTVRDIRGDDVELSSLWRGRTLVLTFLRHFG
jgi:peroxiredoxin